MTKKMFEGNKSARVATSMLAMALAIGAMPFSAIAEDDEGSKKLDTIVVTASGREQALEDTPISVAAFGEGDIRKLGLADVEDLAKQTPGLYYASGLGTADSRPVIRGVTNPRPSSLPAIGVFIDGVDAGNRTGGNIQSFDLDRVEVVRGPQSTLFGRGVLAGAINYITHRPSFDGFSGFAEVSLATDDMYSVQGRVEGPVTDKLALSLSAKLSDFGGFYEDAARGEKLGGDEAAVISASARMMFGPEDRGESYLRLSYVDETQEQPAWSIVPSNTKAGTNNSAWYVGEVKYDESAVGVNDLDYAGLDRQFLRVSWINDYEFDFATLTSRTSASTADVLDDLDSDFTNAADSDGLFYIGNWRIYSDHEIEDFSQELRLTSNGTGPLRWLGGLYFRSEDMNTKTYDFEISTATPDPITPSNLDRSTETLGVFGSIAYDFTDQLTVTGELRWAQDKLDEVVREAGETPADNRSYSETYENILPRVIVEYNATDDVMFYASTAKGNKPGGFNTAAGTSFGSDPLPDSLIAFEEEELWSYEAGVKASLFDQRLQVNASVFKYDWKNIQISDQYTTAGGSLIGYTSNAGKAEATGFEAEFDAVLTDEVSVRGGFSYSPIRMDNYYDRNRERLGIPYEEDGAQLINTPDLTANFGAEYRRELTNGWEGFVQGNVSYNSTLYATTVNLAETGDKAISDIYGGLQNDKYALTLFVTNVFDEDTPSGLQAYLEPVYFSRVFIVQPTAPRQFGIRASVSF